MDPKSDALPGVVTAHRRPHRTRLRKLFTHVGAALSLFLLYDLSHSKHSFQLAYQIQPWKHACSWDDKPFDDYINRVEDTFLSAPSRILSLAADDCDA